MTIVVDSNIIVALYLELPYSEQAQTQLHNWSNKHYRLIAPVLFDYEIGSILRRFEFLRHLSQAHTDRLIDVISSLQIELISPSLNLHYSAMIWARRIQQAKVYDAHYLALAEQENATFWSADKRLVNSARQHKVNWVHWIGEA